MRCDELLPGKHPTSSSAAPSSRQFLVVFQCCDSACLPALIAVAIAFNPAGFDSVPVVTSRTGILQISEVYPAPR